MNNWNETKLREDVKEIQSKLKQTGISELEVNEEVKLTGGADEENMYIWNLNLIMETVIDFDHLFEESEK